MLQASSRALVWLLSALLLSAVAAGAARPTLFQEGTAAGAGDAFQQPAAAATAPHEPAHARRQLAAARQQLLKAPPPAPQPAAPVDPTPEAAVIAQGFRNEAHQLVEALDASGLPLVQSYEAEQEAVASIVAAAEALAAEALAATRGGMEALVAELREAIPDNLDTAAMDALLSSIQFQNQLFDLHVDAVLLVTTSLQPRLPAFAARVHAALATLVAAPGTLEPLPVWSESFLRTFAPSFASSIVEATLLQALWRD